MAQQSAGMDDLYGRAVADYGPSLERLARAYEVDPERRRDLLQDVHMQLWRSFARYSQRCSLRTWVYRVAHNTATSHVMRERRIHSSLVSLEELETAACAESGEPDTDRKKALEHLSNLIQRLRPLDRQVIICYLEELDAASIGEITGLSAGNVAMKIHRIKNILAQQFKQGVRHGRQ